ncbi:MAG: beta-ketoacyl-[acyl-carrier-protein] synthase family protein [Polyangiaceae bacterium]
MSERTPRIAVTGLGAVTAFGAGARLTFDQLCAGATGIGPLRAFDTSGLNAQIAAEVPADCLPAGADRGLLLSLVAAREALAEARIVAGSAPLGLALGSTAAGMLETENELLGASDGAVYPRARRLLTHPLSYLEQALSLELAPFERSLSLCSACSSGAWALIVAAQWIASGRCEVVLAGGVDPLCRMTYAGFHALGVLDSAPCRPFDVGRRGLTLGEGAGFVVLESEAHARRRGQRSLAFLSGFAAGAEAHHVTHPEPTGARAAELMRRALQSAHLSPESVRYVNAHGTGTPANDEMEARAIAQVFADTSVAVSSCKAQLGHTLGAAGALEAVISVLALEQQRVPPTRGLQSPELPELDHVRQCRPLALGAVLSNSFGFGGMDAVLVFEAANAAERPSRRSARSLVLSAAASTEATPSARVARLDLAAGDVRDALDSERSRRFDRATAASTWLARAALRPSGLAPEAVALVLGGAYGPVERSLKFLDRILSRGLRTAPPADFPQLVKSASAGNASIYLGSRGPCVAVSGLAASGEAAFALACELVEFGTATAALAGAVETLDPVVNELWQRHAHAAPERAEGGACLLIEAEPAACAPLARIESVRSARRGTALLLHDSRTPDGLVVLSHADAELEQALAASSWADAQRHVVGSGGYHEALGANALCYAAGALAEGATQALVLGCDSATLFAVELSRYEAP